MSGFLWRAVVVCVVVMAGLHARGSASDGGPVDAESPWIWHQHAPSYQAAVQRIEAVQANDDRVADPGARSIFLTHGAKTARAVLLFHGLTDSPRQFATLAHRLFEAGDNVYVPRLPRHGLKGGDAGDLAGLTSDDLRRSADSSAAIATGIGDSVIVVGLSMGGTMAAWVAQHRPLARAVLIAPALEAARIPSILERPIVGLSDRLPNITRRSAPDSARPDREPGFTTHAAAQIIDLGLHVLRSARGGRPKTREMAVLVNANDHTVKASASEELARRWAGHGARVSLYEIPDSLRLPHNIVDPFNGAGGGPAVLRLIQDLIHGASSPPLVHPLPLPAAGSALGPERARSNPEDTPTAVSASPPPVADGPSPDGRKFRLR